MAEEGSPPAGGTPTIKDLRARLLEPWVDVFVLSSLIGSRLIFILVAGTAEAAVTWLLSQGEAVLSTQQFWWTGFVIQICVIAFDIALILTVIVKAFVDVAIALKDATTDVRKK